MGAASEQMIGKVGCNLATFNLVPACTASSYTTGQLIGTRMEIPNVDRLELGTVFLQDVVLNAKGAVSGAVDVIVFKANPTATTFTDHATYSLDTADVAKVAAVIHLLDQTSHGTPTTLQATQLAKQIVPADAAKPRSVWVAVVARTSVTLAAGDLSLDLGFIQN